MSCSSEVNLPQTSPQQTSGHATQRLLGSDEGEAKTSAHQTFLDDSEAPLRLEINSGGVRAARFTVTPVPTNDAGDAEKCPNCGTEPRPRRKVVDIAECCQADNPTTSNNSHYNTVGAIPTSLIPVVVPLGHRGSIAGIYRERVNKLHGIPCHHRGSVIGAPWPHRGSVSNIPYGITLPPLHQLSVNHMALEKLFRRSSSESIDLGTSDGKNIKVHGQLVSPSQLIRPMSPFQNGSSQKTHSLPEQCTAKRNWWKKKPKKICSDDSGDSTPREVWRNKMEFILASIGASVTLDNFWRFPYLCYVSGGGAFLLPYFLFFFLCGVPLLLLEFTVGQFTLQGPMGAFHRICPLMKGVGTGMVIVNIFFCAYYNIILHKSAFYLAMSIGSEFVSSNCSDPVNQMTRVCSVVSHPENSSQNGSYHSEDVQEAFSDIAFDSTGPESKGILVGVLLLAWTVIYFCLWKSVKSIGTVVRVTATLPFLLIGILACRTLTLPGASAGLQYFFSPRWELLMDSNVWVNALSQNFHSLGIVFGTMIVLSSYNKFTNNILIDTWLVSIVSGLTSVLAGLVVFSTLGNIAFEKNDDLENIVKEGQELIFIVYPHSFSKMSLSSLWVFIFFLLLILLGIDSQFALVQVLITTITDSFPRSMVDKLPQHELLVLIVCLCIFSGGLVFVFQGLYTYQIFDYYVTNMSLLMLAILEIITVVWIYGMRQISRNLRNMTGKPPSRYFRFCWGFLTPVTIIVLSIFSFITYIPHIPSETPTWIYAIGWLLMACCLSPILLAALAALKHASGTSCIERLRNAACSTIQECSRCGRALWVTGEIHHCQPNKHIPKRCSSTSNSPFGLMGDYFGLILGDASDFIDVVEETENLVQQNSPLNCNEMVPMTAEGEVQSCNCKQIKHIAQTESPS